MVRYRAWAILALVLTAAPAGALEWPDVIEEVSQGLESASPSTRRAAADRLASLGVGVALPLLRKALADGDVDVRIAASQSAIRLRAAEATELVLPWLRERDVRLRVAACEVARALPSPKAIADLGRALGDTESPLVRSAAAAALGAAQSPDAVAPLLGRLEDASPAVRVEVARALARLRDQRAVVPLIGKAQDSAPEVRQAVARALGDLGDLRATQALTQLMRDSVLDVKLEALAALGRMRAGGAVNALTPFAVDRTPSIRNAAIAALGRIGSKEAVAVLVGLLGQGEDATAGLERSPVRDALVSAGTTADKDAELGAVLDSASGARASSAAWILGELRASSQTDRVIAALRRGSLAPAAALRALSGCGSSSSVPVVLEYLTDSNPLVRSEATRAAAALLDPSKPDGRAVEPVVAALRARGLTDGERASLARLLGRTGAPRATTPLIALLGAREPALRSAAVEALGQLGPAGADDALLGLLMDSDPQIRLRAAIALSQAGGEKAREKLLSWIDGGDGVDRAAVLTALGGVMARAPTEGALSQIMRSLELAAGGDRDALLLAVGRSRLGAKRLAGLLDAGDEDDRRTLATVANAVADRSRASLIHALCNDHNASVRAQAAFSLGSGNGNEGACDLKALVKSPDLDVACNAASSLARLAPSGDNAAAACSALEDARPLVRANAVLAVAKNHAACGDARLRTLLLSDPAVEVRIAAARALWDASSSPERKSPAAAPGAAVQALSARDAQAALSECAASDRVPRVARACSERTASPSSEKNAVEVFVVPYGSTVPRPRAPYVLELSDGTLRCGTTDRRGAVFDPASPQGELSLRRP